MSGYTEDHLVEQPAAQFMQHELGWDVVNCYGEWDGGASGLGRDGKREVVLTGRLKPALRRLNPDLPVEAVEGAVEGAVEEICRDFFLTALSPAEAKREIDKLRWPSGLVLFAPEPDRQLNRLIINELLFDLKTSVGVSPPDQTASLSEIAVRMLNIITNRSTGTAAR